MSHLDQLEVAALTRLADEMRDIVSERGHHVGKALAVDPAFTKGSTRPKSSLTRALVYDAIAEASVSLPEIECRTKGEGLELRTLRECDRRFRVLRGRRNVRGDLVVPNNAASALAIDDSDLTIWPFELWALVWITDDVGLILEVVAAYIVGSTIGTPGRLLFGSEYRLGGLGGPSRPSSFVGDDGELGDFLEKFFDEDDDEGLFGEESA